MQYAKNPAINICAIFPISNEGSYVINSQISGVTTMAPPIRCKYHLCLKKLFISIFVFVNYPTPPAPSFLAIGTPSDPVVSQPTDDIMVLFGPANQIPLAVFPV